MSLRYLVIIEKTDTGYSAYVPDLPGCITIGDTKKEVEANIQEAIMLHLEGMQEDGVAISTLTTGKNLAKGTVNSILKQAGLK